MLREIMCVICKKDVKTNHGRVMTCSEDCSKEHNRRKNIVNSLNFRTKQKSKLIEGGKKHKTRSRISKDPRDRDVITDEEYDLLTSRPHNKEDLAYINADYLYS